MPPFRGLKERPLLIDRKQFAINYVQQNCDELAIYVVLKVNLRNVLCNETLHCLKGSLCSKKRTLGYNAVRCNHNLSYIYLLPTTISRRLIS